MSRELVVFYAQGCSDPSNAMYFAVMICSWMAGTHTQINNSEALSRPSILVFEYSVLLNEWRPRATQATAMKKTTP